MKEGRYYFSYEELIVSYLEVLCRTSEILGQVVNCSIQVSKTRTIHKSNN